MNIIDGKSYEKTIEYINSLSQFVSGTGCERAEKLLERLGNPQDKLKVIHVAGSNGKGSVCAYLAGILQENGYKTGLFTSPHLIDERERIRINGMMITKEEFAEAYARVKAVEDELGKGSLAYFDYFLGIAFLVFLKQNVDICVIETGLGGRLDATNAVKNPVLDIIATISLEHTAILGDTIEKIAEEKSGIIKNNVPVVFIKDKKSVTDIIEKNAEDNNCEAYGVTQKDFQIIKNYGYCIDFSLNNMYYKNDCFRLSTNALYQMENASIALTVCANLCDRGMIKLDNKAVSMAMYDTHWAGRMELLRDNLYVDGAHNPQGIQSFVDSVNSLYENSRLDKATLLFSVVSDKNYDRMIKILCSCKHFRQIYVTITGGVRKLPADIIKETFEAHIKDTPVYVFESVEEAMKKWDNRLMFATGSLYLVGDVDRALEGKENNHD